MFGVLCPFWMFKFHVLCHGAFSSIRLSASVDWTDIISFDLVGASSNSFPFVFGIVFVLLFFELSDDVGKLFFLFEGGPQIIVQNCVFVGHFANLA